MSPRPRPDPVETGKVCVTIVPTGGDTSVNEMGHRVGPEISLETYHEDILSPENYLEEHCDGYVFNPKVCVRSQGLLM